MTDRERSASPCITSALRAASRRLTLLYDEALSPSGLRVTQYHLLSEVERRGSVPPTVGELAEILVMERSTLGQTLRPLERDGFIVLKRGDRDARSRAIVLTSDGSDAVSRARPYWARAHRQFEHFFGEPAMAELRTTLRALADDPALSGAFARDARSR